MPESHDWRETRYRIRTERVWRGAICRFQDVFMSKRGRYDPEFKQGTGKAKTLRKLRVIGQNVVVCEMPIDRHCLIEQGHIVYTGTQSEFAADPAIRNRYLALGTT